MAPEQAPTPSKENETLYHFHNRELLAQLLWRYNCYFFYTPLSFLIKKSFRWSEESGKIVTGRRPFRAIEKELPPRGSRHSAASETLAPIKKVFSPADCPQDHSFGSINSNGIFLVNVGGGFATWRWLT
jgi:hypothetical protein